MGLLSVAIWLPIVVGAVLLALGRDEHKDTVRWVALVGSRITGITTACTRRKTSTARSCA